MTLRDLIHKIVDLPDWIKQKPDDPTEAKLKVQLADGREITDIWMRGDGVVIVEVEKD